MSKPVSGLLNLNEIGKVARGKSKHRPRNEPSLYGGEYPFIQTGDIKHANLYITDYSQTYNEKGLAQSKLWKPGTLCITIAANIAETAILKIPACFPDSVIGFIPDKEKSDVHFVKYCLDTYKLQMQTISQGTTQDNLSQEKLLSIRFKIPPLPVQQKIAAILSAYDDLIENNNKRIAILEKAAEEIYREWFVRMRFAGWDKVKFVKGVPEGWEIIELEKIVKFTMGQSPKSEFYNKSGDGLPFHQGVGTYGERFPEHKIFCSVAGRMAKEGDILFSVRAPVGRLNIANRDLIIGRGLAAMRHKDDKNSYLFYLLQNQFAEEDVIGNGAIFASVSKNELSKFKILSPTKSLINKFDDIASNIDKQIENLYASNSGLKKSRDLLLSRLISGKLSVEGLDVMMPMSMSAGEESAGR